MHALICSSTWKLATKVGEKLVQRIRQLEPKPGLSLYFVTVAWMREWTFHWKGSACRQVFLPCQAVALMSVGLF